MVNSRWWSDDDEMMIDRSPGPGIIPYSFRIIPSVLLGAEIHRQIYTPPVLLITQSGRWGANQDRKIQNDRTGTRTQDLQVAIQPFSHWTILAPDIWCHYVLYKTWFTSLYVSIGRRGSFWRCPACYFISKGNTYLILYLIIVGW